MKFLTLLSGAALLAGFATAAIAAEGQKTARDVDFSFEGPFGHFDRAQLQRGFKIAKERCMNCHGLRLVSFRNLAEPGGPEFTESQVKALAATFSYKDKINDDGEIVDRPGLPSDRLASPYPNEAAARSANSGALPPDLSLITKARAGWYGTFNQLFNGTGGPEYVYSVLTGYEDAPAELAKETPEGKSYNPYFGAGHWIGMGQPLNDGDITFDDGAPNKVEDMAKDVAAFLAWTAEPKMEERKSTGFMVVVYLIVLAGLLYFVKKKLWARVEH